MRHALKPQRCALHEPLAVPARPAEQFDEFAGEFSVHVPLAVPALALMVPVYEIVPTLVVLPKVMCVPPVMAPEKVPPKPLVASTLVP